MQNRRRTVLAIACLAAVIGVTSTHVAQTPGKNPSPELVGQLTKELSITPQQATGGAGALFGLAKTRLKPDQFGQVAKAVPGMDSLLKAAPKSKGLSSVASGLPGGAGGLASTAGAFKALGLSPDMASKFVPILTSFVSSKGGANVGSLLAG